MSIAKTHSSANLRSSAPASVAFFLLAASTVAFAGPGDLDSSFGDGGRVFIDIPGASDFAATVILQQDGKLLIGRGNDADDDDFSVLRLNADGSFDETFGADGRTSLDAPGIKGTTRIVLLQPDGRIVAAGGVSIPGAERTGFGMARFNTDGSVDSSFGIGGVVTHDLGSAYEAINAVVLQSDGRLAAAGHTWSDVSRDMTFWRFNADGTLDTSFGTSGSTVINFHGSNGPDWSRWLGQQDDGKLIGVGTAWPSNPTWSSDVAVVRLNPDGLRDTTFDADGLVTVDYYAARHDLGSWYVEAGAAALRPDGTIVIAANTHYNIWDYGDTCIPMLAGLTADGSLDTGFGEGGPLQYQFPFCADIKGMVLGPNGDLYSAGALWIGRPNPMVARFTADGQLDLSYGAGGVSVVDAGQGERAGHAGSNSIVLQPDGKVVVVATTPAAEGEGSTLIVARLVEEGTFPGVLGLHTVQWWRDIAEAEDPFPVYVHRTGGSSGTVSVDYETSGGSAISGVDFSPASGTLTWSDGDVGEKLISIGINNDAEIENSESFTLTLSNPSGGVSLGTTELTLRIEDDDPGGQPNSPPAGPSASGGGAVGPELAIVLTLLLLARLLRGVQGFRAVLRAGTGMAVVASGGIALAADGDLDPTFGQSGRVSVDPGRGDPYVTAVIRQADGKLVIAGWVGGYDFAASQFVLVRLQENGTLDAGFGTGGLMIGSDPETYAGDAIQQADGKLVVAGSRSDTGHASLWRFNADGTPDAGFGAGGTVVVGLAGFDHGAALVQQASGKLVIAGHTAWNSVENRMMLARFDEHGALDTTFGSGGTVIIDFGADGHSAAATSLSEGPDGTLLLTGDWDVADERPGAGGYSWLGDGIVALVRTTADGMLDPTFGNVGRLEVSLPFESQGGSRIGTWGHSAALQADGKIVITGGIGADGHIEGFALRLAPDGTLDSTFGMEGIVNTFDDLHSVAIEPNGKIVTALHGYLYGYSSYGHGFDMALTRFNSDGSTDTGFGIEGFARADFGLPDRVAVGVVSKMIRLPDGDFVVAGTATYSNATYTEVHHTLAIARFAVGATEFPGLIGLTSHALVADENGGPVAITVRRTGGSTGAVSVAFRTADEAAIAGSDYQPQTGRLDWADGDVSDRAITVDIIDDPDVESATEVFRLELDDATGGAVLTTRIAMLSIADDDSVSVPPPGPRPNPVPDPTPSHSGGGGMDWLFLGVLVLASLHTMSRQTSRGDRLGDSPQGEAHTRPLRCRTAAVAVALLFVAPARAETVTVDCGNPAGADYGAISAALDALGVEGPHTVQVQPGICFENVLIEDRERLVIEAPTGNVSIVAADPEQDVVAIINSRSIVLRAIAADGGRHGFTVVASSGVRLEATLSSNNSRHGYDLDDNSSVHLVQSFASGNADFGMLSRGSYAHVQGGGFTGNGRLGINCRDAGTCQLDGDTIVENNAEGGIQVFNGSLLRMLSVSSPVTLPSTIQGNGFGVSVSGSSRAVMFAATITGNNGPGMLVNLNSGVRLVDSSVIANHDTGIHLFANSSLELWSSRVNNNHGVGIVVDGNSTLADIADSRVRSNAEGILIIGNSVGLISDAPASNLIRGNGGSNVACDAMSLVRGDLAETRKVRCANLE